MEIQPVDHHEEIITHLSSGQSPIGGETVEAQCSSLENLVPGLLLIRPPALGGGDVQQGLHIFALARAPRREVLSSPSSR